MGITRLEKDSNDGKVVIDTLIHDAVGRNKYLWQFACFCSAQEERASIALDAGWGTGKSFFLRQLQMFFDAYSNHPKQLTADQQNAIKILFEDYEKNDGLGMSIRPHVCIYYDAWLNDNAEDPMRSILHEIITETNTNKLLKKGGFWRKIHKRIRSFFRKQSFSPSPLEALESLCKAADEINPLNPTKIVFPYLKARKAVLPFLEYLKNNNPVREIDIQKRFHDAFEDYLDKAIINKKSRLLVLIDELDRCKPTYAVQLLERIKHYLSNEKITFIFAINEGQLLHTIKAFYGEGFDAYRYLDRFFDYRLSLPKPDINQFNKYYGFDQVREQAKMYSSVCDTFIQEYPLSPREAIKYRQWVKIICDSFLKKHDDPEDKSWCVVIFIIIPVVLGLKIKDNSLYPDFMNGRLSEQYVNPLHDIINSCQIANDYLSHLRPPRLEKHNGISKWVDKQNAISCIDTIYKHLFKTPTIYKDSLSNYGFNLREEMRDTIFLAPTLMDDFIKFDTNTEETAHG